MLVRMKVLRDGYWDGQYPRAGDTIAVEDKHVEQLEVAGFAMRDPEASPPRAVLPRPKGDRHGR